MNFAVFTVPSSVTSFLFGGKELNIWKLSSALSILIIIVGTQSIWPFRTY